MSGLHRTVGVGVTVIAFMAGIGVNSVRSAESRPPDSPPSGDAEELKDELTLRQALALALLRNPELSAFSLEVRARDARILQSRKLPNPTLDVVAENVLGTGSRQGSRQGEYTVQVSQLIELGGKRSARVLTSRHETEFAKWDYEAKRLEILTRVGTTFIDVVREQQRLQITDTMAQSSEEILKAATERVKAGKAPPVEETKAKIALSSAKIDHERAVRALAAARFRLAALWGSKSPVFTLAKGDLKVIATPPPLEELDKRLAQNPEALRQRAEVLRTEASLKAEKAKAIPDVTVGSGYRKFSEGNDGAFVFNVSIPLPFFDRNQGGIRDAEHRIAKANEEQRATDVRISSGLSSAYQNLLAIHNELTDLEGNVLPKSQEVFNVAETGYKEGKFGYLDVLDAQKTLYSTRLQYLQASSDYHQAVLQVEQLIGEPLSNVSTESDPKKNNNSQKDLPAQEKNQ